MNDNHAALVRKAERVINMPRRDWRFWAALAACCAAVSTLYGLVNFANDRDDARSQVEELSGVQACRSRAALVTENAGATLLIVTGKVIVAAGNGVDIDPFVAALKVAADNNALALDERTKAIVECEADPDYVIDPSVFAPIPDLDD